MKKRGFIPALMMILICITKLNLLGQAHHSTTRNAHEKIPVSIQGVANDTLSIYLGKYYTGTVKILITGPEEKFIRSEKVPAEKGIIRIWLGTLGPGVYFIEVDEPGFALKKKFTQPPKKY